MEHLTDQQLGRYLDGELSDIERSRVERHLDACERCRSEVARLRETSDRLNGLIEAVELPERLREADVYPRREGEGAGSAGRSVPLRAAAAAAVLLLAGSVAVPGSPVRGWVAEAAGRLRAAFVAEEEPAPDAGAAFGLQIRPEGGRVEIHVRGAAPGTRVAVRLVGDSLAGAWAPGARLRSEPGRLEVVDPGRGEIRIDVPRRAREAVVTADGRTVFRWEEGRVVLPRSASDSVDALVRLRLGSGGER